MCAHLARSPRFLARSALPGLRTHLFGSGAGRLDPRWESQGIVQEGLLPVEACNALYNRVSLGICFSSSNPSRVPFEMMAAGLPVLDLHLPNNLFDPPEEATELAAPSVEGLAHAILELLNNPLRLDSMGRAGHAWMAQRSTQASDGQFLAAVNELLESGGTFAKREALQLSYHRPPRGTDVELLKGRGSPVFPGEGPVVGAVEPASDLSIKIAPATARLYADGH